MYHSLSPNQPFKQVFIEGHGVLRLFLTTARLLGSLTDYSANATHALGEKRAVIAGHDLGSHVDRHCALLRPDIFRAVILSSTPFVLRNWNDPRPTEWMKQLAGDQEFYILYFQEPGKVDQQDMCHVADSAGVDKQVLLHVVRVGGNVMHIPQVHEFRADAYTKTWQ